MYTRTDIYVSRHASWPLVLDLAQGESPWHGRLGRFTTLAHGAHQVGAFAWLASEVSRSMSCWSG